MPEEEKRDRHSVEDDKRTGKTAEDLDPRDYEKK